MSACHKCLSGSHGSCNGLPDEVGRLIADIAKISGPLFDCPCRAGSPALHKALADARRRS